MYLTTVKYHSTTIKYYLTTVKYNFKFFLPHKLFLILNTCILNAQKSNTFSNACILKYTKNYSKMHASKMQMHNPKGKYSRNTHVISWKVQGHLKKMKKLSAKKKEKNIFINWKNKFSFSIYNIF